MNTRPMRLILLSLAFGILLAMLLVPQTRWLVRAQLLPSILSPNRVDRQRRLFVQQHPDDYQIQLAGHLVNSQPSFTLDDQEFDTQQPSIIYARSLVSRFPESASLRANILRFAMQQVHLYREEPVLLDGGPVMTPSVDPRNPPPTPAQLAAFDADAAAGERLDPDNAFFPFLRSIGLFAARRDTEGLAAVQRASTKHVWREYSEDEVEGRRRITDGVSGDREAVASLGAVASVLLPHYLRLRSVARIVVYKAVVDEQSGNPEAGFALRQSVAHCGELMRLHSTFLAGNILGVEISAISRLRPGGVPPLKAKSLITGDQQVQARLDAYCIYAARIGHPDAAMEARAEYQAGRSIYQIANYGSQNDYLVGGRAGDYFYLVVALIIDGCLFANILSLSLLSLAAAGLGRLPRIQALQPLPFGATLGCWSIAVIGGVLLTLFFNAGPWDFNTYATPFLLTLLILAAVLTAALPRLRRPIITGLLAAGVTLGVIGLLEVLAAWQMHTGLETLTQFQQLVSGDDFIPDTLLNPDKTALVKGLLDSAFGLAVPLLCAVVLSIRSRVKRVPVSVGLAGGFRAIMPPLVFGLMLVYGGLTLWTVRQEARLNYGLERSLHGEGQYLAQLTGETWPSR